MVISSRGPARLAGELHLHRMAASALPMDMEETWRETVRHMSPRVARRPTGGAAHRLQAGVRRRGGRLARRLRAGRPQVSAVVLLHEPEESAQATLDAVRDQPLAHLEILLVVLDERLRPLAERSAREDWRARVVDGPHFVIGMARQAGVRAARGRWLLCLSSGQVLLPGALEAWLVAERGGQRAVLGGLQGWDDKAGVGWASAPTLGRLLVPRSLWGAAADDAEPAGQVAALSLLVDGHAVIDRIVLRDDSSGHSRPFKKMKNPMPELSRRVAADRSMLDLLDRAGLRAARQERARGALARDLPRFLLAVEHCDGAQWDLLSSHAADLLEAAGMEGRMALPVEDRLAAWLAAHHGHADLATFVAARRFADGNFPTQVRGGRVIAGMAGLPEDLPETVRVLSQTESGLAAQVRRSRVEENELVIEIFAALRRIDQRGERPEVRVSLQGAAGFIEPEVVLTADPGVTHWMGEPDQCHDLGSLAVRIPVTELGQGDWRLVLDIEHDGVRRRGSPTAIDIHGSAARPLAVGELGLRWRQTPTEVVLHVSADLPPAPTGAVVRQFEASLGQLALQIDAPSGVVASLAGPGQTLPGVYADEEWIFDLVADPWGLGPMPAPSGIYRLALTMEGVELPVSIADSAADLLPAVKSDQLRRTSVWRGPRGGLMLRLDPPLRESERGRWAQRKLKESYWGISEPVDPRLVYFQSFLGQSPTDHPAAIQAELNRALTEGGGRSIRVLWAVMDSSMRVPDGAEPVLVRSREWYWALARAGWVVTNIDLEPWFIRRPRQEVLETYHGYPSKAMGLTQWRARGLAPSHIDQMLQRTSGTWNNLLTPIPEMDCLYRENYDFAGRIVSVGYPRDDALVLDRRGDQRRLIRERLRIAATQRAVLYAPTWRDDLATNFRSATALLHLDIERAAAALGPDYVILVRGHRFHQIAAGGAQIIDVTTYPEINDLILAADVAVLDYSSLRFDFAITGRPMVFLVPDLQHYTEETRGFLYDFADSAPGPFVDDTDGVVRLLLDLPALERQWRSRIDQFNAYYNRLNDGQAAKRLVAEFFGHLLS